MNVKPSFRQATVLDLANIVVLHADDTLGAARDGSFDLAREQNLRAFAAIEADPNNELWVVEDQNEIVGQLQLTFIPGLSQQGSTRCEIEAVRIASQRRG